jgi:hypothetical protein
MRPLTLSGTMLLALPLEIWEIIFDLLPGQDLQLVSKVGFQIDLPSKGLTHIFVARFLGCVSSSRSHGDQRTDSRSTKLDLLKSYGQDLAH